MIIDPVGYRASRASSRVTPRSMQDCTLPKNRQTPTQQLEACLPPDAKPWEKAVVAILDFLSLLSGPKN